MRRATLGRACLLAAGLNSVLLGAYHFVLPVQMQWASAVEDVPGMVRWALFALNFDFSLLVVFVGVLAWCAVASWNRRSAATLACAVAPAVFWIGHAIYLRLEPMPIPDALGSMRLALEGFTVIVVALSVMGALLYVLDRQATSARLPRRAIAGGGVLGVAPLLVGVIAIVTSLSGGSPASTSNPAAVENIEEGLEDRIGLLTLESLCPGVEPEVVRMSTSMARDLYLGRWPELAPILDLADSGDTEGALAALDTVTVGGGGELNLRAQLLREAERYDEAREAMDAALAAAPDEHLHHHQDAQLRLTAIAAESSMLAKWRLANEATQANERALESNPHCLDARLYLIFAAEFTPAGFGGDSAKAMRLTNEGLVLEMAELLAVRAFLQIRREDFDAAAADATASMAAGYYQDGVVDQLVSIMLDRDDTESALRHASFGVRMNPAYSRNWVSAGAVLQHSNEPEFAILAYEAALEIEPENEAALTALDALRPETTPVDSAPAS